MHPFKPYDQGPDPARATASVVIVDHSVCACGSLTHLCSKRSWLDKLGHSASASGIVFFIISFVLFWAIIELGFVCILMLKIKMFALKGWSCSAPSFLYYFFFGTFYRSVLPFFWFDLYASALPILIWDAWMLRFSAAVYLVWLLHSHLWSGFLFVFFFCQATRAKRTCMMLVKY